MTREIMETAWNALDAQAERAEKLRILDLFEADSTRAETFTATACGMVMDYSKTAMDKTARAALLDLADAAGVGRARDAMFDGEKINITENRAVLHTVLRNAGLGPVMVDGEDVTLGVRDTLARMGTFAGDVRAGRFRAQGGAITDVVNIGIGGSDLGPVMAMHALSPFADGPRCHFVSNVDGADIADMLAGLDPQTTLIIVASKTFTTIETMTNATTAWEWMSGTVKDPGAQFVALSSAEEKTAAWGIPPERVFGFEDWVGGRYSVWGPIGLSLMLAIGADDFDRFLAGGAAMDAHFRNAPLAQNMPVMLALVGLWHHQGMGYPTRAVLPYEQRLLRLPAYLQQLEMESNGKRVNVEGQTLERTAGPVVWGEPGTNGQHAFFQLIHQGRQVVPCEFLIGAEGHEPELAHHHRLLQANCLAQSEALMRGRTMDEARTRVAAMGFAPDQVECQAAQRVFPGNRPSLTIAYRKLTPEVLGQIIALYEHRVFVEGVILGINSFDQWGVELGKELATALDPVMRGEADGADKDGSTRALAAWLRGKG